MNDEPNYEVIKINEGKNVIALVCNMDWLHKMYESTFLHSHGWGNGYVAIDQEHPFYGMKNGYFDEEGHFEMTKVAGLDVSGGVTFSGNVKRMHENIFKVLPHEDFWVIGFDTNHFNNNESHDKNFVIVETMKLYNQINEVL